MDDGLIPSKSPYHIIYNNRGEIAGLGVDGDPSITEASEMLVSLAAIDTTLKWLLIDWLSTLPMHYGRTLAQAVELTGYSESTLAKYRLLGKACPPEKRDMTVSITHHMTIYTEFEPLSDKDKEEWMARLNASVNDEQADGQVWSNALLRFKIRESLGWEQGPWKGDKDHQLIIENDKLSTDLKMSEARSGYRASALAEIAEILEDANELEQNELVERIMKAAERASGILPGETELPQGAKWVGVPSDSGGWELYSQNPNGSRVPVWASGHHPDALETLKRFVLFTTGDK